MPAPATSAPTSLRSRPRRTPNQWQPIGAEHGEQISNGALENWDTAGFDGLYTLRLSVMENSGNVLTYDAPLAVDNTPPKVSIVHPGKDELYKMEDDEFVSITADAEDNWEMDRVEFYVDGAKVGESTVAPYGHRWTIKMADKAPKLGPPIMATRTITNTDGTTFQEEYVQSETRVETITRKDGTKVQRVVQYNDGGSGAYMDGKDLFEFHTVYVKAYDKAGNEAESEKVRILVRHKPKEAKTP